MLLQIRILALFYNYKLNLFVFIVSFKIKSQVTRWFFSYRIFRKNYAKEIRYWKIAIKCIDIKWREIVFIRF